MAAPLRPLGHTLVKATSEAGAALELQVFLDLTCPFCKRMFQRLQAEVLPFIEKSAAGRVGITAFTMPQPWHPQGTMMAEAALAVESLNAAAWAPFVARLYETRDEMWVDDKIMDLSRNQIYDKLSELAGEVGVDAAAVRKLLTLTGEGNSGTAVIKPLKLYVKYARAAGIHVSPSVLANGIMDNSISSGWTGDQWQEYINKFLGGDEDKK